MGLCLYIDEVPYFSYLLKMYQLYNVNQSVQISHYWVRLTLCYMTQKLTLKNSYLFLSGDAVTIRKQESDFPYAQKFIDLVQFSKESILFFFSRITGIC